MSVGIYKITSPSGKVYIGQSWDIENRFSKYRNLRCHKQRILFNSLKKYGSINHVFEIIHELPTDISQTIMDKYEIFYIKMYRSSCVKLLNIKDGGSTGKHSESSIKKMSGENSYLYGRRGVDHPAFGRKHTPEHIEKRIRNRRGINHPMYGRKHTEESINRIKKSISLTKNSKAIEVLDSSTGIIYSSIRKASIELNINYGTLSDYLNQKYKNKTNLIFNL